MQESELRSSPTFHAVTLFDNFFGLGSVPRLDMRQMVSTEQSRSPATVCTRTCAEFGRLSKFSSWLAGSVLRVFATLCPCLIAWGDFRGLLIWAESRLRVNGTRLRVQGRKVI